MIHLTDEVFKSMLAWMMVSDPWPLDGKEHFTLTEFLNQESRQRGYDSWTDAYHALLFKAKKKKKKETS